jgi:carbamoyltransferase
LPAALQPADRALNVLGISAFYHDSAACLVRDGRVVAAAQEERFSRIRFDASLPLTSIRTCLEIAGISPGEVDAVAFYEKPLLRFDRVMATFLETVPGSYRAFVDTAPGWMRERLRLPKLLSEELGWRGRIVYVAHHEAHAASAFLASPFEDAAILTVDGVGEWTTNAIGRGRGGEVTLLEEIAFPHSLGLFYAGITEYLGYEVLSDEYKVMGLASYGEPRFADVIREHLIHVREDGSYRLDLPHFRFVEGARTIDPARFERLFGGPVRRPEGLLEDRHADVAASVQAVLEDVLLRQARHARSRVDAPNLVLAGGVALNAVANGRLAREAPFDRVWVQPAAGDAGGALGAALLATHRAFGLARPSPSDDSMSGALLGPAFDDDRARAAATAEGLPFRELTEDAMDEEVARRLAEGQVVGWFQGRMEFGPRALGSRSILADPRSPDARRRVNERIKFREGFRPFAPAVLETRSTTFFDLAPPSPYMLFVANVVPSQRVATPAARGLAQTDAAVSAIPAVTHVDGTARVQTVDAGRHPRFHRLVSAFDRLTGCPVVLNTSFNLRGEPIVCTPEDALRTFLASEMNAVALGGLLVERPGGPSRPLPPPPTRPPTSAQVHAFARDLAMAFAVAAVASSLWGLRRHSPRAVVASVLFAAAFFAIGWTGSRRPQSVQRAAALWRPVGEAIGRAVSFVALSLLYVFVLAPLALLRRGPKRIVSSPPDEERLASHWRPWEGPRGASDRMY